MLTWEFLSYSLSDNLSAYRNGERISVCRQSEISKGDTCNQSKVAVNLHFGTHVDFPWHFFDGGKTSSDFSADFFVADKIRVIVLNKLDVAHLVSVSDIEPYLKDVDDNLECLIIKTGLCNLRYEDAYWNDNVGVNENVATFCRNRFPFLRFIGFDFMSVSGIHHRMLGREVHKEFFRNNILPIEDMDLSRINSCTIIKKIIISPYRVSKSDAAPATVFAQIEKI